MSDRAIQSVTDANRRREQTAQSYQSVWMTHWMSRSSNPAPETRSPIVVSRNEQLNYVTRDNNSNNNLTNGSQISSSSIERLEVVETKSLKIVDQTIKVTGNGNGNDVQALSSAFECRKAVDYKSPIQFPFGEGTSKNPPPPPPKWMMETRSPGTDLFFALPKEKFVESSSRVVSYKFDMEKYNLSFSATTKAVKMESNLPPRINNAPSREFVSEPPKIELPDINLELALPGTSSSSHNIHNSFSNTQSTEMDKLAAHVEWPKPKSNFSLDDDGPNPDPDDRWVKRLKLNSTNSYTQVMKSETTSNEKTTKLFGTILKSNVTNSEPTPNNHRGKEPGKEPVPSDETGDVVKNKGDVLPSSDAWIQRWLRNGSRITKRKPEVVFEPQRSELAPLSREKKQLPSVAAMALMGRALNDFRPCEIQRRGAYTVWNTNGL